LRQSQLFPLLTPAIAFLAPVVLSLYFTFVANDFNRGLVWDSAHYVLSAQSLLQWLSDCLHHHYVSPKTIDLGPSLMVDGPVLPAFGAALIAIGQLFHKSAEVSILVGQSLTLGLNSLLLYLLARRLVGPGIALIGALLFGFNPASIVSSSQFLTEQLTATTLVLFSLALSLALPRLRLDYPSAPSPLQYAAWVVLGGLTTLILHLKTALFPTLAILLLLALVSRSGAFKGKLKIAGFAALGFFIVILPWLVFSKLASGRITLAPNRVPSINLAVGMDLESDAWGVAPPTESVLPIIFDKPSAIGASLWLANPQAMTCLFLRKIERIFAYSWNDFCWPVLGVNIYWQCFLQSLILAAALLGAIYVLVREKLLFHTLSSLSNASFLKLMILVMVAGHFVFVPFESQPRYGYSAVPYLILLALIAGQNLRQSRRLPLLYAVSSLALIVLSRSDFSGTLVAITGTIESALTTKNLLECILFGLVIAGGCSLAQKTDLRQKAVLALVSALLAFAFLQLKREHLAPPEWCCHLEPGTAIARQIDLPEGLAGQWRTNKGQVATWAALLIDGDENIEGATITVNGRAVEGKPLPLLDWEQAYAFQATIRQLAKVAAATRGQAAEKLRQWRLVRVPVDAINLDGRPNKLTIQAGPPGANVFGQYRFSDERDKKLWIPSLYGFSALRLSILGDSRTSDSLSLRAAASSSHFIAGANGNADDAGKDLAPQQAGQQQGEYRLYLILAASTTNAAAKPEPRAISFKDFFVQIF
jgi:4-amino-4-deoxy-L-arabinose transferase-like glycosyltransferase